jgi:hypothetical protein
MDNQLTIPSSSGFFANGIRTSISEVLYNYAFFCPQNPPSELAVQPQNEQRLHLSVQRPAIPIPQDPPKAFSFSLLSLGLFVICLFFSFSAYSNKQHDFMIKQTSLHSEALRHFYENKCDDPVPMTQEKCLEWGMIIAKNPLSTNSAEILTSLFADLYDSINSRLPIPVFLLLLSLAFLLCSFLLPRKR